MNIDEKHFIRAVCIYAPFSVLVSVVCIFKLVLGPASSSILYWLSIIMLMVTGNFVHFMAVFFVVPFRRWQSKVVAMCSLLALILCVSVPSALYIRFGELNHSANFYTAHMMIMNKGALDKYKQAHGRYPTHSEILELKKKDIGKVEKELIWTDNWGNDFRFEIDDEKALYRIISYGRDNKRGDHRSWPFLSDSESPDLDLIYDIRTGWVKIPEETLQRLED